MTTRPQSIRIRHERILARSWRVAGASLALVIAGVGWALINASLWSIVPMIAGIALFAGVTLINPRLRAARQALDHVEDLRHQQASAAEAQRAAMERAFQQPMFAAGDDEPPTLRSPQPSSSGA